jgi:single-strand DNA-binding protein
MATSRSLNKVLLIGNLTRNPVLRSTANGSTVCTFGVATNDSWKDSSGNVQERTEFHNVVAWNKLAEICAQILATGMLVWIEGELRTRTWEDGNGGRKYKTEIKINDMKLLDDKDKKGVGIEEAKKAGDSGEAGETELVIEDEKPSAPATRERKAAVAQPEKIEKAEKEKDKSEDGDDLF